MARDNDTNTIQELFVVDEIWSRESKMKNLYMHIEIRQEKFRSVNYEYAVRAWTGLCADNPNASYRIRHFPKPFFSDNTDDPRLSENIYDQF